MVRALVLISKRQKSRPSSTAAMSANRQRSNRAFWCDYQLREEARDMVDCYHAVTSCCAMEKGYQPVLMTICQVRTMIFQSKQDQKLFCQSREPICAMLWYPYHLDERLVVELPMTQVESLGRSLQTATEYKCRRVRSSIAANPQSFLPNCGDPFQQ